MATQLAFCFLENQHRKCMFNATCHPGAPRRDIPALSCHGAPGWAWGSRRDDDGHIQLNAVLAYCILHIGIGLLILIFASSS